MLALSPARHTHASGCMPCLCSWCPAGPSAGCTAKLKPAHEHRAQAGVVAHLGSPQCRPSPAHRSESPDTWHTCWFRWRSRCVLLSPCCWHVCSQAGSTGLRAGWPCCCCCCCWPACILRNEGCRQATAGAPVRQRGPCVHGGVQEHEGDINAPRCLGSRCTQSAAGMRPAGARGAAAARVLLREQLKAVQQRADVTSS